MSSDGHALTGKIIDHGIVNANVSSAEYDEKKSHEDTSKMTSSVRTQKLDANQLAAKILRLRMKGNHEEADQLSVSVATILHPSFSFEMIKFTTYLLFGDSHILIGTIGNSVAYLASSYS
jgi:hypothetical protein